MNYITIDHCLAMMTMLGVNPRKIGSRKQLALFIFMLIHLLILVYLVVMLFFKMDHITIPEGIDILTNILMDAHAVVYLACFYVQRPKILQILSDIEEKFWNVDDYKVPGITSFYYYDVKMIRNKYFIYCGIMFICSLTFNYVRIIEDKRPIAANLILKAYIPEGLPFWGVFVWEHIQSVGIVTLVIAMDTFIFTLVSLTIIQIKMLHHEIKLIFEDSDESNHGERIKKCSQHHTFILSFRDSINETFSLMILVYMVIIMLILCMEVYLIFLGKTFQEIVRTFNYLALMLFEFCICYCFPAQELITQSECLADTLYCTNWYLYQKNSKDMLLFLGKCQMGISVDVGGMTELDLKIGAAVLKTMVSYSMFLRTMTQLTEG